MNYDRRVNKDGSRKVEKLIAALLMIPLINGNISEILNVWNIGSVSVGVYFILYLLSVYVYFLTLRKNIKKFIAIIGMLIMIISLTFYLNPETMKYAFNFSEMNISSLATCNIVIFLGLCIPILLLFTMKIDLDFLMKKLFFYSKINMLMFICLYVLINFIYSRDFNYMTIAYNAMLSIFICFHYAKKERNSFWVCLTLIACVFIIIGGSRGGLFTLVAFFSLRFIFDRKKITFKKMLLSYSIVSIIVLTLINIESLIYSLNDMLSKMGYTSRILKTYINYDGGIFFYSDREMIQKLLIGALSPFGHGLYGDRVIIGGQYAHNFFLEILTVFGVIFGSIIIVGCLMSILKAFFLVKRCDDDNIWLLFIISVSLLFVKYMVSGSFLRSQEIFFILGSIAYINRNKCKILGKETSEFT